MLAAWISAKREPGLPGCCEFPGVQEVGDIRGLDAPQQWGFQSRTSVKNPHHRTCVRDKEVRIVVNDDRMRPGFPLDQRCRPWTQARPPDDWHPGTAQLR